MSNLVAHAQHELSVAGLLDKDSDYDGMLGEAALELVTAFSKQGHSGFSAALTVELFRKLASYEALTPLTNNPDEWVYVADDLWQNKRQSDCFSTDGGKTYKQNGTDEIVTAADPS
jgi:hypothetical protein